MTSVCSHFNLRYSPFTDTFPLKEAHHTKPEAADLERMLMLVGEGKSFSLTGEPGCGKSMLLRTFSERFSNKEFRTAMVSFSGQKPNAVLREICEQLRIDATTGWGSLLARLRKSFARSGSAPFAVILLDEAHLLPREALQEIFSLTHDAQTRTAAATIVLSGHPYLEKMLALDSYASVRTRLVARFRMQALDEAGIRAFIAHRLALVKAPKDLFHEDAIGLIAMDSKGNRRMAMNLAGNCLNLAVVRNEKTIAYDLAKEVCDELR
jgi:type II secretory pathway predicted ATPase ExeA